jgi:SAM-dependent methyltransferase
MSEEIWSGLSAEAHNIWNENAAFWDDAVGEGNQFQRLLIGPAQERLLAIQPGEWVLDVACSNGHFARRLAVLGAKVVAFDFSETFIARAQARTTAHTDRIEYQVLDATNRPGLLALGQHRFDAAVCTMALMDMAEIDPLLESLPFLLKPGGRFVFSVSHPCFNSIGIRKIVEEEDRAGEIITQYAIKVVSYITPATGKGLGILGQPKPHHYFDRPLNLLFNHCFRAGFVLDGLEEPAFGLEV